MKSCESLGRVPERFPPPYSVRDPIQHSAQHLPSLSLSRPYQDEVGLAHEPQAGSHRAERGRVRGLYNEELGRGEPKTVLGEARHGNFGALEEELRARREGILGAWGANADEREVSPGTEDTLGEDWWATIGECLRDGLVDDVRHVDAFGREVRGDGSLVDSGEEL